MIGLGAGLSKTANRIRGVIKKNLQLWLGFKRSNVKGEELVDDISFLLSGTQAENTTGTYWTTGVDWTISNGVASQSSGNGQLSKSGILTAGLNYSITVKVDSINVGETLNIVLGSGGPSLVVDSVGTHILTGVAAANEVLYIVGSSSFTGSISELSIKEVTQLVPDGSKNTNKAKLFTGKALEFNGNDSVVLDGFTSSGDTFTFAFWVNNTTSGTQYLFDANAPRFVIAYISSVLQIYSDGVFYSFGAMELNQFNRVVITVDGTSAKAYVDGVPFGTTQTIASVDMSSITDITLGSRYDSSTAFFNGLLSDFQIYNAAWDSDDALFDYNNPNHLVTDNPNTTLTLSNLSAYYALSEGSGNKVYDSTGLGAELVGDVDFSLTSEQASSVTGTYWTTGSDWTISNNKALFSGINNRSLAITPDVLIADKVYRLTFTVSNSASSNAKIFIGNKGGTSDYTGGGYAVFGNDTHVISFTTPVGQTSLALWANSSNGAFSLDGISVKLAKADDGTGVFKDGNGAVIGATWVDQQDTIPQLGLMDWSKGSNLIEFSEDFSNSSWLKVSLTVTDNSVTSPIGNSYADLISSTSTASSYVNATPTVTIGNTYVFSCFAKKGNNDWIRLGHQTSASTGCWFDLANGVVGTVNSVSATITDYGDGWYLLSNTFIATTTTSLVSFIAISDGDNLTDSAIGLTDYIFGAQLEESSTVGSYIGTNGSAASNATLIQNPNDKGKDVLGNTLRLREKGFNLDGSGYAEVADDDSLDFGTGDFTFEMWVSIAGGATTGIFISKIISNIGFQLYSTPSGTGEWYFMLKDGISTETYRYCPTSFYGVGWCRIAVVVDRSQDKIDLYFNNAKDNGASGSGNLGDLGNINNSAPLSLPSTPSLTDGLIDEVKIYNRALTLKELQNNYKVGLPQHSN